MCIAIVKPEGQTIPLSVLEHCWNANPDGCGFALPDGAGGVTIHKALDWEEFVTLWDRYGDAAAPMLVHFRLATHGIVNLENCHPHRIAPGLAMVHNGIYHEKVPYTTPPRSDTVQLVKGVLQHMPPEDVTSPSGIRLIEDQDYGWSRTALLNGDGQFFIIRERRGEWIGGCWYSKKLAGLGRAA